MFSLLLLIQISQAVEEQAIAPDRITSLLASHYDCSKATNLQQYSLTTVEDCTRIKENVHAHRVQFSIWEASYPLELKAYVCDLSMHVEYFTCKWWRDTSTLDQFRGGITMPMPIEPEECKKAVRELKMGKQASVSFKYSKYYFRISTMYLNKPHKSTVTKNPDDSAWKPDKDGGCDAWSGYDLERYTFNFKVVETTVS